MKYYSFSDPGYYNSYFGNPGQPREITKEQYYSMNRRYVVVKAPASATVNEIRALAAIKMGAHPKSYRVQEIMKGNE